MEKIEVILSKRGYVVTEKGELLNPKGDKIGWNEGGYVMSNIRVNKVKVKFSSHRLQAYQKYGDRLYEEGMVVRHFDGDSLNNSWENILIGTQSDNMMDIPEQIRIKRAKHATSFVKKHEHLKIIKDHEEGLTYAELMDKYNISSKGTIYFIIKKSMESKV